MLYGTNPSHSSASSDAGDRDYDPSGLGSISPNRAPAVHTTGGGYGTQGTGGGGNPGPGESSVAGSRASGYRPTDRSVSVRSLAARGKARYSFSKSGRGSKAYEIGSTNLSPISGMSGLGDLASAFFNNAVAMLKPTAPTPVSAPIETGRAPVVAMNFLPPLPSKSQVPGSTTLRPAINFFDVEPKDDSGMGSWLGDRFKGASRIITPPNVVKNLVPKPIRTAIRYAGAATTAVVTGGFVPQPMFRQAFGLSAKESSFAETALKVTRGVSVAVVGGGAAYLMATAPAATPAAGSLTQALSVGSMPPGAAIPYGPSAASIFGTGPGLVPASGSLTASLAAASAAPSATAAESYGAMALKGTGAVLKAVGIQVGSQALLASLSKGPGGEAAQAPTPSGYEVSPASVSPMVAAVPMSGGQGGGGSYADAPSPIEAGFSPVLGIGMALAGAAMIWKSRRKK